MFFLFHSEPQLLSLQRYKPKLNEKERNHRTMKAITTPNPTLKEWIEQMRLLCIQNNQSVRIQYDNVQAIAEFYVKGENVGTRKLYRL